MNCLAEELVFLVLLMNPPYITVCVPRIVQTCEDNRFRWAMTTCWKNYVSVRNHRIVMMWQFYLDGLKPATEQLRPIYSSYLCYWKRCHWGFIQLKLQATWNSERMTITTWSCVAYRIVYTAPWFMELNWDQFSAPVGIEVMWDPMSVGIHIIAGWWWLEHDWIIFPFIWEFYNPNWRIYIFQRGRDTSIPPTRMCQVFPNIINHIHRSSIDYP